MTLSDILRFFSGAADGQRMGGPQEPVVDAFPARSGVLSAPTAGGGRGFVNPPMANPRGPRPQNALMPLAQGPEVQSSPVAAIMTGASEPTMMPDPVEPISYANPSDAQMVNVPGATPMQRATGNSPGILDRIGSAVSAPGFLGRVGTSLAVAGSQDPTKALLLVQQQRAEEAKRAAERASANRPKIVGSAGPNGAIQLVQMPDGSIVPKTLEEVMEMNKQMKSMDFQNDVNKALAIEKAKDDLKAGAEERKRQAESSGERVQAGLNVQQLNQIADSLDRTDSATGPIIGLLPKWARDIVTPDGASLQDAAERIIQGGLRATLGGQFTQAEGDRFLARAYNPRLDEKANAQNLRTIAREIASMQLDKSRALDYFQRNGTLEGFVPNASASGAPAAPAPAAPAPAAPARGGLAVPGLSPRASQYFQ
jgi:hypothetical protein